MIKKNLNIINNDIRDLGLPLGIRKFAKKCNTKILVQSNKKVKNILSNGSGIIVANHPAEADVLAILGALKKREDVFLIINSSFRKIIPKLDKHLIPVYLDSKGFKNFGGKIKTKILRIFHKTEIFKKEIEREKNIKSIKNAISKINKGALVIIFPDGGNKRDNWFNGIGRLVHGIKNKKSFIVRAHIKGTSNFDYLRLFPFLGKLLPSFQVTFAKAVEIEKIKKENPRETTLFLEKEYWQWRGNYHLWSKLSKNYLWLRMLFLFLVTT